MRHYKSGFILFSFLIFLMLLSALVLSQENELLSQTIVVHNLKRYRQNEQQAVNFLHKLNLSSKPCQEPLMDDATLMQKTDGWWRQAGLCHLKKASMQVDYFFTYLSRSSHKHGSAITFWQVNMRSGRLSAVFIRAIVAIKSTKLQTSLIAWRPVSG